MLSLETLQEMFVRRMPSLRKMARISFRYLPPGILASCLRYSVRQTKAGRTPQGCPRAKDVLSRRLVGPTRLPDFDPEQFVGRSTPVPEAVSFKVDVPAFLASLSERQRSMALDLAQNMTTTEAAAKYGLSPGRISQFRREFKDKFDVFFAE